MRTPNSVSLLYPSFVWVFLTTRPSEKQLLPDSTPTTLVVLRHTWKQLSTAQAILLSPWQCSNKNNYHHKTNRATNNSIKQSGNCQFSPIIDLLIFLHEQTQELTTTTPVDANNDNIKFQLTWYYCNTTQPQIFTIYSNEKACADSSSCKRADVASFSLRASFIKKATTEHPNWRMAQSLSGR